MFQRATRLSVRLVERYLPDAYVFVLIFTALAFIAAFAIEQTSPLELVRYWGTGFWELLSFGLNAALFILVGLQLPGVMDGISGLSTATITGYAVAVSAAVIVVRFLWVFPSTYLPRLVSRRIR